MKVFHVGGRFFINEVSQYQTENIKANSRNSSFSDHQEYKDSDDETDSIHSLDYLPNELKFSNKFYNTEAERILSGQMTAGKEMIVEFFRGITLCHQANVSIDKGSQGSFRYIGVLHDELASLDFAQQ